MHLKGLISEEVQNGDVASGVKCVWNVLSVVLKAFISSFFRGLHRRRSLGCSQSAVFKLEYKSKQRTSTLESRYVQTYS